MNRTLIVGKKMTLSFVIRKYQPGDREQCRSLWKELTEWHREIYQDPNIGGSHPEDYFDKHLAKVGPDRLWVAVHDSQVVGLVGLIVGDEETEIEPLVVSKAYRHKGIGKQLTRTVVSEARNLGVRFLDVKPVARNIQAIKFLYEQGFKNLGHIELFLDFSEYSWKPGPQLFDCKFDF
jgi:ribosomal protein S18 acetylase RimI-like enzyme